MLRSEAHARRDCVKTKRQWNGFSAMSCALAGEGFEGICARILRS